MIIFLLYVSVFINSHNYPRYYYVSLVHYHPSYEIKMLNKYLLSEISTQSEDFSCFVSYQASIWNHGWTSLVLYVPLLTVG